MPEPQRKANTQPVCVVYHSTNIGVAAAISRRLERVLHHSFQYVINIAIFFTHLSIQRLLQVAKSHVLYNDLMNCKKNINPDYKLGWVILALQYKQIDTHKCNFHFIQRKFSQPFLLPKINGKEHKWPVYSFFVLFFLICVHLLFHHFQLRIWKPAQNS